MGDAFSRWDGFSYYASFSEFIPSLALAFTLWSIVAVFAATLVWLSFRILITGLRVLGLKIEAAHFILYTGFFTFWGGLVWKGKKIFWPDVQTAPQIKYIIFIIVAIASLFFIWVFRKKAEQWVRAVLDRITPLVWLFGVCIVLSLPLVSYHAWLKDTDGAVAKAAAGPAATGRNSPNIILLTFDALAARNMSAYGYRSDTTPFISRWSKNATLFAKAEANSNFTTPAVASLMTGKRVWTHQTYHIEGSKPVRSDAESLPYLMKKNGYFTIALVANPFASARILGMSDSFDIAPPATEFSTSASLFGWKFGVADKLLYRAFGENIRLHNWILNNEFIFSTVINLISRNISQTTVPPDRVFDRFMDIIDSNLPKPFFAWIHVFPPHDPYLPPEPYKGKFNDSVELREYKSQEKLIEESYKYLFQYRQYPETMQPQVNLMRDYYDEFITYTDITFETFIGGLKKRQIENTVVILSADHGESFEHGYFSHGGPFLYEQVTHIPLIIREPGQNGGLVISDRVEQIDIAPTILDLVNMPAPLWMEGRSLVPFMRGESVPGRPAFTMNLQANRSRGHQISSGSIAVWEKDYKLIHYLEKEESLLFNLRQDPGEQHNLFDHERIVGERLRDVLFKNLKTANERIISDAAH